MARVYIGIGSNLGKRQYNCKEAIKKIEEKGLCIKKLSSMYETKPWGLKEQPLFINMVIEVETEKSPEELLKMLKEIETEMGRIKTVRWGPRIIDLDILLYNNEIIDQEDLKIPHPFLHQRDFVLLPLSEIAPEITHPLLKKTIKQLKEELLAQDVKH